MRRLAEQAHEPPGRALSRARRTRRLVGLHDEGDCLNIPDATARTAESRAVEPSAEPEVVETIDIHNRPAPGPAPAATARDSSVPAAAAVATACAADDVVDPGDPPWE